MMLHQAFTVPSPSKAVDLNMADGARIRLRRYGRAGRTRLVLSHGNGLAINAYAPFWLPLTENYDVVVFDMRNHGENPKHTLEGHTWKNFFLDIEEVFQGIRYHFGPAPTVAVVHSLSSVATIGHVLWQSERWDALCLFDPPIMPPAGHPLHEPQCADMEALAERALRRQEIYDTPDQLAEQFRRRASFGRWIPEAADLLARHTLRQLLDGRWTLCCPPAFESEVFRNNVDPTLFPRLDQIQAPLRVIAGDPNSPHASPAAWIAKSAHEMYGIDYQTVRGTTHFLQIEEPRACRDLLNEFLTRHGLD
jgi:pimeloyl-ACP methyl ester carboxylesterase